MAKSQRGKQFERDLAAEAGRSGKRVPMSGAVHEYWGDLAADVHWKYPFWDTLVFECKHGYGGNKQATIYREWFDKLEEQARDGKGGHTFIPMWALKFKFSHMDEVLVMTSLYHFKRLLHQTENLYEEKCQLEERVNTLTDIITSLEEQLEAKDV